MVQVQRKIEARSCNLCRRSKAISITYSERVPVALLIQHSNAHAPYYIVICGLSGCTRVSQTGRISEGKLPNTKCVF